MKDPENFYREQLLLFYPWFQEGKIIGQSATYKEAYIEVADEVLYKRQEYESSIKESEQLDEIEQQLNDLEDNAWDEVAPVTQHKEQRDRQKNMTEEEKNKFESEYDLGLDLGLTGGTDIQDEKIRNRMEDEEYRCLVRSLNQDQKKKYFIMCLKQLKMQTHRISFS